MTTNVVITSGTTWLVPADWNNASNTIYAIGGGGPAVYAAPDVYGGQGGGFASITNEALVPGAIVSIQIGIGGGTVGSGTSPTGNTWFLNGSTLVAAGGDTGNNANNTGTNSVGSSKFAGGGSVGSNVTPYPGGGGAGGPSGAGAAGSSTSGGQGDNGTGGAGGAQGANGLGGVEIASLVGSGGGAGPYVATGTPSGGNYGGGGGAYGVGAGGVLIITYTPAANVGQDTWPTSESDDPSRVAHKVNPYLMMATNYTDTGSLWYGMSQIPLVNTFVFDADGGPLPLRTQYIEAVAQRFNALLGQAYDDTGARAYAAFVIPAATPKTRFDPGMVDILPIRGFVGRQAQIFSLLRGQAYDDTGAHWYAEFSVPATTPKVSFGADGGLLPIAQFVEAQTSRFALLRGQAYDDTGARWYAASSFRFLVLIPNIFFVQGNELISDMNTIINYINYDLSALGVPRSKLIPYFTDMHPNGFADMLNVLVKRFNTLPTQLVPAGSTLIKQFLSIGGSELTLALNTLIDEMNVFIMAQIKAF